MERLRAFISVGFVIALLTGCGVLTRGPGPWVDGLEDRNPLLADLELQRATRTERSRNDPGESLSYQTPGHHVQRFAPNSGETFESVRDEILAIAQAEGWVMASDDDSGLRHRGERERTLPGGNSRWDRLTIEINRAPITGIEPHVSVSLSSTPHPTG